MSGTRGLRQSALRMAALAESILARAIASLRDRDVELAARIDAEDLEIDRLELEIDDAILAELPRWAAVKDELRMVLAVKSMIVDLERVGDLARSIARSGARLAALEETPWAARLEPLEDAAAGLLRAALDSFQELDPDLARSVIDGDDAVDELHAGLVRELIGALGKHPECAAQLVHLLLISEGLERIADHATNVAEDVILVTEARSVKHAQKLGRRPRTSQRAL
jgi:phosphate transport system protein